MILTMSEACARLNCTPRQLRYRIKKGEIEARKVDGRWHIQADALPRDPAATRQELARAADLEQLLSDGLARRRGRRRYTVEDLHVFTALVGLAQELRGRAPEHPAVDQLVHAGCSVSVGVHAYGRRAKAEAFSAARRSVADAVGSLHMLAESDVWPVELARRVEDVVLPALAGLLRRQERSAP